MISSALFVLALSLRLAVPVVLLYTYFRTRDVGFLWLVLAIAVIWSQVADVVVRRVIDHQLIGIYPFSLVARGQMTVGALSFLLNSLQQIIGAGFLLTAVFCLSRTRHVDVRAVI